jgi:hypothetical protein
MKKMKCCEYAPWIFGKPRRKVFRGKIELIAFQMTNAPVLNRVIRKGTNLADTRPVFMEGL